MIIRSEGEMIAPAEWRKLSSHMQLQIFEERRLLEITVIILLLARRHPIYLLIVSPRQPNSNASHLLFLPIGMSVLMPQRFSLLTTSDYFPESPPGYYHEIIS